MKNGLIKLPTKQVVRVLQGFLDEDLFKRLGDLTSFAFSAVRENGRWRFTFEVPDKFVTKEMLDGITALASALADVARENGAKVKVIPMKVLENGKVIGGIIADTDITKLFSDGK